jgi:S1-C subfamily serine protease
VPPVIFRKSVIRTEIPPELATEAAFLGYLNISRDELKKIWWYRERMYRQFVISNVNGKVRTISAPNKRLLFLQRQITYLLNKLYRVRNPVHGFVSKKSVKTNAEAHLRKCFVINLDLLDFFPSITEKRVRGVLASLNIDSRVSAIIARLSCFNSHLPQGAPTSPILSNMICFRLDKQLLALAKENRCIYTRYADDITFSSRQPITALFEGIAPAPGHFPPSLLAPAVRNVIQSNGFRINPKKAHYADRYSRRTVTGLKINEFVNVDRRYIRNIRATIYSIETLGHDAAQAKFERDHGGKCQLAAYLKGKISWLRFIRGQSDPVFRAIALRFNDSFPNDKIEVLPTVHEIRDRSVWVVEHFEGKGAQGTAFFLKEVGLVTAAHCVEGATEVDVYHQSKHSNVFKAEIIKCDRHRDLAILKHEIPLTEYFELERSTDNVTVGDDVIALGFPGFAPGDSLNVREGKVSSSSVKNAVSLIEVTQKLSQGMSGGPLLDSRDAVVGVIHKGGPDEGRDFAVSIEMLNAWIAESLP